ncbi:hypothetical protein [Synechococcus phage Ssp-JY38]|nr:hypothetical protein [Synechococcus phage Yong-L2-223]
MRSEPKDDSIVLQAIAKQNNGHHGEAAALFQRAGNQYRNPAEKQQLWDAARRARNIADSD